MKELTDEEIDRQIKLSESGEISKAVIYGVRIPEIRNGILKLISGSRVSIKFKLINLDPEFNYIVFIDINKLEEPNDVVFRHILEPFGSSIMLKEGDDFNAEGELKVPASSLIEGQVYLTLTLAKVLGADKEKNKYNSIIQDSKQIAFKVEEE